MGRTTPQDWLNRWGQGLNGAGARIKQGVQAVTQAPGQAAAAKADKMKAGINASIDSGRWAQRVGSVPLAQWQDSMANKGVANISAGVTQAQKTKVQAITNMLNQNDSAVAAVQDMPTDTLEQRLAKAQAFMRIRSQMSQQS